MKLRIAILLTMSFRIASNAIAEPSVSFAAVGDESANFQDQVLLSDLDNPAGLVLRPMQEKNGHYELIFAESGAGRVLSVSTNALDQVREVIVGFSLGSLGLQPKYRVGPLSLALISRTKLVVSAKGASPGRDVLVGYTLPADVSVLAAADQDHAVGPLDPEIASHVDDLQFCGLAMKDNVCFITSGGQGSQGWVLKSGVEANRLTYLQPYINMPNVVGFGAPAGIAIIPHPRPAYLVVGLMGSRETPQDSRLAFFVPANGELALNLPIGLHDIVSLAYSPSGQLYAADFSWHDEQAGGVFRIDDAFLEGRPTCQAVKIASIVRPFCLAFAPDGSLFVTAFGEGENAKQGTLVKITGDL